MEKIKVSSEQERQELIALINMMDLSKPWEITWKQAGNRTLSANALYWQWMTDLANKFSVKGQLFTKDDMHDLMRHKFLGYESKTIGRTEIQNQLISTTKLSPAEFCHYMNQIDAWAVSVGVMLPTPENSELGTHNKDNL